MASVKRSVLLLLSIVAAASGALLVNCSAAAEEDEALSEDEVVGVNNTLGLGLAYDELTGKVRATLKKPLGEGERLFIRVRRGTIRHESQAELDCRTLAEAPPIEPGSRRAAQVNNRVVYDGPSVSRELVDLLEIYNDERWYGGNETPQMRAEIAKGPDSIVEACVMKNGRVRAKLLTNLAYAWERGSELRAFESRSTSVRIQSGDAGAGDGGGPIEPGGRLEEGPRYNTIDYANICVQELGEIPFFKKIADGKYETFDCREFVGSNDNGAPARIDGVESALVPLSVDDQPRETCDPGRGTNQTYDCVDKCDRAMWLTASSHTGLGRKAACQPGVTVSTAKNDKGTHWVLLCRKVQDTGNGVLRSKTFNDIAIVGSNPKTGQTCFFQNKENIGNDGSRVTHPGDVARSTAIWPAEPSSYCTKNCHATDAFIHSPWIDEAKRSDGTTIVPMLGRHSGLQISDLEAPYRLVNGPAQGFVVPKQLVGEKIEACTSCHRVGGSAFAEFSEWSTGSGDAYFGKITESYKAFAKSHWMPPRLEGLTAENFEGSAWGVAVKHIRTCSDNPASAGCEFADVPQSR